MRYYVIGDIHGQIGKLDAAHREITRDRERVGDRNAPVIHLGDLVDRGPDSRGVIEYLMHGIADGAPWVVLKGNHDRMFADFVREGANDKRLFTGLTYLHDGIGGRETLRSYGVVGGILTSQRDMHKAARNAVPEAHLRFLETLPLFKQTDSYFFVHAGIEPGVAMEDQVEEDLLWIRGPFLESRKDHGRLVVHGHTPVEFIEHHGNRVAVDTGAGFGGPLVPAVLEDGAVFALVDEERLPISPPPV
ncbi:MAG: metallophosphoesterase family protein [Pseudomonadota bacterium]